MREVVCRELLGKNKRKAHREPSSTRSNGISTTAEMSQQLFWDAGSGRSYTKEQAISLGMFQTYQKNGRTYRIFRRDNEEKKDTDEDDDDLPVVTMSEPEEEESDEEAENGTHIIFCVLYVHIS